MRIRESLEIRLRERLAPSRLEIDDQSALHAGHAGSRPSGETHFHVLIASSGFAGLSRLARQRLVIDAVGDLMHGAIHALSITALTPEELAARSHAGGRADPA